MYFFQFFFSRKTPKINVIEVPIKVISEYLQAKSKQARKEGCVKRSRQRGTKGERRQEEEQEREFDVLLL